MNRIVTATLLAGMVMVSVVADVAAVVLKKGSPANRPTTGLFGTYPPGRDASGTSWQPEVVPMGGVQAVEANRSLMLNANFFVVYTDQGGPRGGREWYTKSMFTGLIRQDSGKSTFAARAMFSLDPLNGVDGYPLLLQTGETADDRPLVDRQHPHDFFSELALIYRVNLARKNNAVFVYAGIPGEPALGPPVYLHRFSGGVNNPEAPISHHWLDSTHIAFGVLTFGYVRDLFKFEASAFNGREPDENRWDIETPRLDSYSARISFNPARTVALQASSGWLAKPEALEPDRDVLRTTLSIMYSDSLPRFTRQITAAWGLNDQRPGDKLNAFLLEAAYRFWNRHTAFFRVEQVEKNDLFPGGPLAGLIFAVNRFSLGYEYEVARWQGIGFSVGGMVAGIVIPEAPRSVYGDSPFSYSLFLRGTL